MNKYKDYSDRLMYIVNCAGNSISYQEASKFIQEEERRKNEIDRT